MFTCGAEAAAERHRRPTTTVVGSAVTTANGSFTITAPLRVSGTLAVSYAGSAALPAAKSTVAAVTAGNWTPALTLSASSTSFLKGTTITLSGTATKTYNGVTSVANGLVVYLYLTPSGGTPVKLGALVTSLTGTYTLKVAPTVSGTLTAVVSGSAGYLNTSSPGVPITVF